MWPWFHWDGWNSGVSKLASVRVLSSCLFMSTLLGGYCSSLQVLRFLGIWSFLLRFFLGAVLTQCVFTFSFRIWWPISLAELHYGELYILLQRAKSTFSLIIIAARNNRNLFQILLWSTLNMCVCMLCVKVHTGVYVFKSCLVQVSISLILGRKLLTLFLEEDKTFGS